MRTLGITAACVLLSAAATAANAVTINGVGHTHASITRSNASNGTTNYGDGEPGAVWQTVDGKGGSYEATVQTSTNHVSFKSGVAVSGDYSVATATSIADVTVTNDTGHAINIHNFGSTIIPAGLGFYLQNRSGPLIGTNIFTGYGEASGYDFGNLNPTGVFAMSSFDFEITADGYSEPLYSLTGSVGLLHNSDGIFQLYGLSNAAGVLAGFTGVHGTPDNPLAYAYAWDSTNISVALNKHLGAEESIVLHYSATVSSATTSFCVPGHSSVCLVGYSGFGDPIGRGGGVDSLALNAYDLGGPITNIVFDPVDFDPVSFGRGDITNGGGVPEPATWALMILGFGSAGAALRRRRALVAA